MKRDLYSGLIFIILGIALLTILVPMGIVEPRKVRFAALSPSYYPRIVAGVLLLLGLAVAWRSRRETTAAPASNRHPNATGRIACFIALLGAYALLLPWLGFVAAGFLGLLAAFWIAGEHRLKLVLPLAVLVPLMLYFFFLKVALIPIPTGLLTFLLQGV
jgi:putative tricarboxylic transport membrane protein